MNSSEDKIRKILEDHRAEISRVSCACNGWQPMTLIRFYPIVPVTQFCRNAAISVLVNPDRFEEEVCSIFCRDNAPQEIANVWANNAVSDWSSGVEKNDEDYLESISVIKDIAENAEHFLLLLTTISSEIYAVKMEKQ